MKKRIQSMDVTEHPLDKPIQHFADALETWLGKWGRRITQVLWKEYQNRLKGFRRFTGFKQASLLDDEELWQEIIDSGYGIAFPFENEAAYAGYAAGEEMLLNIGAVVDFDLVNPHIIDQISGFTMHAVTGTTATTRAQLRRMMRTFYTTPDVAKNDFIAALEPLFGRTRAEMIAVTEMTNAYSAATIETARHAPIDVMYEVSTVRDPLVCIICQEAEAGGPYPLDDTEHRPALHPRCRCDAVIVERPEEIPEKRPFEEVILRYASDEDKEAWAHWAGQLPDEHLRDLKMVEYKTKSAWETGLETRKHADAVGLYRKVDRKIIYQNPWGQDAHVLTHEIGHHAMGQVDRELIMAFIEEHAEATWWAQANPGVWNAAMPRRYISEYALKNSHEFFAEHYSAYIYQPRTLKVCNPKIYKVLQDSVFGGIEFI